MKPRSVTSSKTPRSLKLRALRFEEIPEVLRLIRRAVETHGMYVQLGLAESALHGNAIFNSTALIGPEGVVSVFRRLLRVRSSDSRATPSTTPEMKGRSRAGTARLRLTDSS